MGGYGSGRPDAMNPRPVTEDQGEFLSVAMLRRYGTLAAGSEFTTGFYWFHRYEDALSVLVGDMGRSLEVTHLWAGGNPRQPGEWTDLIYLPDAPCHFGGSRLWFLCPKCERRCETLYLNADDRFSKHHLLCRICKGLAYQTQRQTAKGRGASRIKKLRFHVGGFRDLLAGTRATILDPFPARPKGMHHRTYERIRQEAEALMNLYREEDRTARQAQHNWVERKMNESAARLP